MTLIKKNQHFRVRFGEGLGAGGWGMRQGLGAGFGGWDGKMSRTTVGDRAKNTDLELL